MDQAHDSCYIYQEDFECRSRGLCKRDPQAALPFGRPAKEGEFLSMQRVSLRFSRFSDPAHRQEWLRRFPALLI